MDKIQFRRDTLANWASANPILAEGEIGYVLDDPNRYKMGDGIKTWDQLPFRGFDGTIVHELGEGQTVVMSQDAVSKEFASVRSDLSEAVVKVIGTPVQLGTDSAKTIPYEIVTGKTYYFKNNDTTENNFVSVYVRETKDGANVLLFNLLRGTTKKYTADANYHYIRCSPNVNSPLTSNYEVFEGESINGELQKHDDTLNQHTTQIQSLLELQPRVVLDEIAFEQGGIGVDGNNQDNNKRIRSINYLYGGYSIILPSGYNVYLVAYYDKTDNSYIGYKQPLAATYTILSTLTKDGVDHSVKARVAIAKTDNTQNIIPEDIKKSFVIEELYSKSKTNETNITTLGNRVTPVADIVKNVQVCETAGTVTANAPCIMLAGKTYKITNISDDFNYFAVYARETATSTNITVSATLAWKASVMFTPDVNCQYIRLSAGYQNRACKVSVEDIDTHEYRITDLESELDKTNTELETYKTQIPTAQFEFSHDLLDFIGETLVDFIGEGNTGYAYGTQGVDTYDENGKLLGFVKNTTFNYYPLFMEQMYAKMDALMQLYPSYITKVDLCSYLNMEYPDYARVDIDQNNELAYHTYMYILKPTNEAINSGFTKLKKTLWIGGEHSDERPSTLELYYMTKGLCECMNNDYFKLRNSFEIHIVPVLNGYGSIHTHDPDASKRKDGRVNYNGVNINRNYPSAKWVESGQGTSDYSGPSAGSEFETQLMVVLNNKEKYDMIGDFHSHVETVHVAYSEYSDTADTNNRSKSRAMYDACTDISLTFKKNYPAYYGMGGNLLPMGPSPAIISGHAPGFRQYEYFAEAGVPCAFLNECPCVISWNNGTHGGGWHEVQTDNMFSLNEYLFRIQVLHFADWVLRYVK